MNNPSPEAKTEVNTAMLNELHEQITSAKVDQRNDTRQILEELRKLGTEINEKINNVSAMLTDRINSVERDILDKAARDRQEADRRQAQDKAELIERIHESTSKSQNKTTTFVIAGLGAVIATGTSAAITFFLK